MKELTTVIYQNMRDHILYCGLCADIVLDPTVGSDQPYHLAVVMTKFVTVQILLCQNYQTVHLYCVHPVLFVSYDYANFSVINFLHLWQNPQKFST